MFTGLVEKVGEFVNVRQRGNGAELTIKHDAWDEPLVLGESVAVQGVCLTVVKCETESFTCDVLNETLNKTNLGSKKTGDYLNLERAMKVGARFGGHIVSGHVDGLGEISGISTSGDDHLIRITCGNELGEELITKGSIAIDGISLTVTAEDDGWFEVALIPHTWTHTSLSQRKKSDYVNLETDMLGKYVKRYIGAYTQKDTLTMDTLTNAGF